MKIIVTGENGYLSTSLKKYFERKGMNSIALLNVRDNNWEDISFSGTACVIHCAALVHKNENNYTLQEYEEINCHLTRRLAEKAKAEGVSRFIFISTMSVYGVSPSCFRAFEITPSTVCAPTTKYGISKLHAEEALLELSRPDFAVSIVRPPIIYGKGCPGNYASLKRLTLKLRVVPKMKNKKSMIFIDNLCEFLFKLSASNFNGVFLPQNRTHANTSELAYYIAEYNRRKIVYTSILTPFVYAASLFLPAIRKAFGNEYYSLETHKQIPFDYIVAEWKDSIRMAELGGASDSPLSVI